MSGEFKFKEDLFNGDLFSEGGIYLSVYFNNWGLI